ncbi:MAG: ATP-binding protein [Alphaproteobacteria bacterium]
MLLKSLTGRLLLSAGAWSLIALVVTGFILASLFRSTVERQFDVRLDVFVKGLIAELAVSDDGELSIGSDLPEPRFNFPLSGWYWQINVEGRDINKSLVSPSLLDQHLEALPKGAGNEGGSAAYLTGPDKENLRVFSRNIKFSIREAPLNFIVAGDASEIDTVVRNFNATLFIALSVLGLGLIGAAFLQVRFGLRPLRALSAGVARIRAGRATRLTGEYPTEISPLGFELNALLDTNEEVITRARTHVGNLAHALKTPLSVLHNDAQLSQSPLGKTVQKQVQIMRDQVDHYLERARVAARANVLGAATEVAPVVAALCRTLVKINRDKKITLSVDCEPGVQFRGERQDLEEMIGNLLDNAFKWTSSKISVRVVSIHRARVNLDAALAVIIDDDGAGLSADQRDIALKRGQRIDESKPGSGLGLSIVGDIASMYKGDFELGVSQSGGLRARLLLPAVGET